MFKGNKIYKINKDGKKKRVFFVKGLFIKFKGKNSVIELHEPYLRYRNSRIVCGDNCRIIIDSSTNVARDLYIAAHASNGYCKIGKNFLCTNDCLLQIASEPNKKIIIGDNCMFGSNIIIRTTDSHSILDKDTREVLNEGKDIEIGNNCWLATGVKVLKGVRISDNIIVGLDSIVNKNLENEFSVYAGAPAKLVKTNVVWDANPPGRINNQ